MLTGRPSELLADERKLLGDLREVLATAGMPDESLEVLRQAIADLDQLFLLVVVGEFNAGKSAFINALLGHEVTQEGVTPTTAAITIISYTDTAGRRVEPDGVIQVGFPIEFLRQVRVVDTPGTNAILRHHERLTRVFIPRSDLVLFVTSADRPFTESERAFLETIRAWGKKVVLVLNKVDLLRSRDELDAQLRFIEENAARLLGFVPEIFPVSARLAAERNGSEPGGERDPSGFTNLEAYLYRTLDEVGRVKLKLLSPLGVGERLADEQRQTAGSRLAVLREDLRVGEQIDRQLKLYRDDLQRDLEPRLGELENVIRAMGDRGQSFFDETLRVGRIFDLFNSERIRAEFERQVIADAPDQVDRLSQELIDWMVEQDIRLWRSVADQVDRRRETAAEGDGARAGRLAGSFEYDRRALLQSVGRAARDVLQRHDHQRQAEEMARSVREAVTRATLMEAGAVSLGAVTMAVVGSAAADVTGLLAAGVMAGLGFYILPLKRRRAAEDFRRRTDELREGLSTAMRSEFDRELDGSLRRIRDALSPYDRFVRAEQERIGQTERDLAGLQERARQMRIEIDGLGATSDRPAALSAPAEPSAGRP